MTLDLPAPSRLDSTHLVFEKLKERNGTFYLSRTSRCPPAAALASHFSSVPYCSLTSAGPIDRSLRFCYTQLVRAWLQVRIVIVSIVVDGA